MKLAPARCPAGHEDKTMSTPTTCPHCGADWTGQWEHYECGHWSWHKDTGKIFVRSNACYEREIASKDERIQRLEAALDGLLEQYDDRKAQWGSEYLWEKHECTEVIEQARAALPAGEALAAKS